jgi:serine/threonine-protein kinase
VAAPPTPLISTHASPFPDINELLDRIAAQSHFEERYDLKDRIFQGRMGEIWHAFDRLLGREVAVKLARPDRADSRELRGQFLKEAKAGSRLLHPNILPVFDLGVNRQRAAYFTMRFVQGASLRKSLDALATACNANLVSLPLVSLVEMFNRACQGIDFAHQRGVLHLDLKPDNILVSAFSEVFVIDWGLARVDDQDDSDRLIDLYHGQDSENLSSITATGMMVPGGNRAIGTPGYMAPEQAQGAFRSYGPATDVFGLGGILYYILYGTPPTAPRGTDPVALLNALSQPQRAGKLRLGLLPRGVRINPKTHASIRDLERICLKTLERDPSQRYASVNDLIIELNEWLSQMPRDGSSLKEDNLPSGKKEVHRTGFFSTIRRWWQNR